MQERVTRHHRAPQLVLHAAVLRGEQTTKL